MSDLPPPPPSFGDAVFSTPQSAPLAGWWSRAGALIIDTIILGVVAVVLIFGLGAVAGTAGVVLGALLLVAGAVAYEIGFLVKNNGQTIGRMATGIRVASADNPMQPIGAGKAWGRWGAELGIGFGINIVSAGGSIGALAGLVLTLVLYLWPIWDEKKQTWYDKAAGTIVVRA